MPTKYIVQTTPPLQCTDFVRLEYDPADIIDTGTSRTIVKQIGGVTVTIEATANDDGSCPNSPCYSTSRLNVYNTDGSSPGNCDTDIENLVWDQANAQPEPPDFTNVLVVQETSGSCGHPGEVYEFPNDDGGGGNITISFSSPITVKGRIFVIDQDELASAAKLYINDVYQGDVGGAADSEVSVFLVPLPNGDGSITGVSKMHFDLHGSGAVGPVDICV